MADALQRLAQESVRYRETWWERNEAVQRRCADVPGLRGRLAAVAPPAYVTTQAVYWEDVEWAAERTALHAALIDRTVPRGGEVDDPIVFFTTGCTGSGKSTTLRRLVEAYRYVTGRTHMASVVDADHVRRELPEYEYGLGAHVVEPECYDVTYGPLLDAARVRRADIIYDTIGHEYSIRRKLQELVDAGYRFHFLVADIKLEVAADRIARRALEEDGRIVPPEVLSASHGAAQMTLEQLASYGPIPGGWAVVDTSGPRNEPILLKGAPNWTETFEDAVRRLGSLS